MPPSAQDLVIANYQAQHAALVAGDYDALGKLLSDGFTRTHFTGGTARRIADVGGRPAPSSR